MFRILYSHPLNTKTKFYGQEKCAAFIMAEVCKPLL